MRIIAVGDSYMQGRYFKDAFAELERHHDVTYVDLDESIAFEPRTSSELKLSEYLGSPRALADVIGDPEILVVQGAPVTAEVLDGAPALRLVGCARGGPVNIDVAALAERGIALVNAPGKNADAVADLTLALIVMLARRLPEATAFVAAGGDLSDNWVGRRFLGHDLAGQVLGLIGYGQVGQRVARRARAFGTRVLVYDPYAEVVEDEQVWTLEELLGRSDFVSLHARAASGSGHLIGDAEFAMMRPGACLINTARQSLLDEAALDRALSSGTLAGAALDVFDGDSARIRARLQGHRNVVIAPHIGGATAESLRRGAAMLATDILRFAADETPLNLVVPPNVDAAHSSGREA